MNLSVLVLRRTSVDGNAVEHVVKLTSLRDLVTPSISSEAEGAIQPALRGCHVAGPTSEFTDPAIRPNPKLSPSDAPNVSRK